MSKFTHSPVMLHEVIDCLAIKPDGYYVDATFGRGGHTQAILNKLGPTGKLIAIDKDLDAVHHARAHFSQDPRFEIHHGCFSQIPELLKSYAGKIDGIIVDLGVSSAQLDDPKRGFSFRYDSELDMRMDQTQSESAAEWLSSASSRDISWVLKKYGEEIDARRIADKIIEKRALEPIKTTKQLTDIVTATKQYHKRKVHPATLTFQAIRIHVNQEMQVLEKLLSSTPALLNHQGVMAILSFHSLEDRMVKHTFRGLVTPQIPKKLPVIESALNKQYDWHLKRLKPSINECAVNPRARSAVLRAIRKTNQKTEYK